MSGFEVQGHMKISHANVLRRKYRPTLKKNLEKHISKSLEIKQTKLAFKEPKPSDISVLMEKELCLNVVSSGN